MYLVHCKINKMKLKKIIQNRRKDFRTGNMNKIVLVKCTQQGVRGSVVHKGMGNERKNKVIG